MGHIYDPQGNIIAEMTSKTGESLPDWHMTQELYDEFLEKVRKEHLERPKYGWDVE